MLLSMPVSRAVFNLSALLMVAGWLLSGNWRGKFGVIQNSPIALAATSLFGVLALGALYGVAPPGDAADGLLLLSKLLYIPLIASLMQDQRWQRIGWTAYVAGMGLTLAVAYLDLWLDIPGTRTYTNPNTSDHGVFYHHIAQSVAMAFFAVFALHQVLRSALAPWKRWIWALGGVLAVLSITHLTTSRTGQLALLAGLAVAGLLHAPRRWAVAVLGGSALVFGALALSSPSLQKRFELVVEQVQEFRSPAGEGHNSVGLRLHMWRASLQFIQEKPLLGHGVGTYPILARQALSDEYVCSVGCTQPHNQFLQTTVEHGLVGLAALLSFFGGTVLACLRGRAPNRKLVPPLIAIFATACLFDSALLIRPMAFSFIVVLGLLAAGPLPGDEGSGNRNGVAA